MVLASEKSPTRGRELHPSDGDVDSDGDDHIAGDPWLGERERKVLVDATTVQVKVDSCYAYASHRDVVRMFWPQHYRPQKS